MEREVDISCIYKDSCNHIDCNKFCMKKFKTGYYFLFVVEASADAIEEFNRVVGINECVLRHLVVKKED